MMMMMMMMMLQKNLSEEFFTAPERPEPWNFPQATRVRDVGTLKQKFHEDEEDDDDDDGDDDDEKQFQ